MRLSTVINGKPLLWGLLAVPAAILVNDYLASDAHPGDYLHGTGEWSARLVILALMLTPLSQALPGRGWVHWLLARRRAFGVAAFGYALLHLLFYLADMGALEPILAEFWALGIWTGWAAFLLLVPLFLTSNQRSMRAMKSGWKRLQRLAYPAALLSAGFEQFGRHLSLRRIPTCGRDRRDFIAVPRLGRSQGLIGTASRYPIPGSVRMMRGSDASSSIFCRSKAI